MEELAVGLGTSSYSQATKPARHQMRYHDYHLISYEVSDGGEIITFNLVYGNSGQETDRSCIRFSDVVLYNFVHTNNAIIVDIDEVPISELIEEIGSDIVEWNRRYGVRLMSGSLDDYALKLQTEGYKAWRIESAIGFYGYVPLQSQRGRLG